MCIEGWGLILVRIVAPCAANWDHVLYRWADRYPQLRSRAAELGLRECIQQPREIIYVPQGPVR